MTCESKYLCHQLIACVMEQGVWLVKRYSEGYGSTLLFSEFALNHLSIVGSDQVLVCEKAKDFVFILGIDDR